MWITTKIYFLPYLQFFFLQSYCLAIFIYYLLFCLIYDFVIWIPVNRMDEGRQPLWRKLPISSSRINPYRIIIVLRIAILCLFFHYRILHPVNDAYALWLTSVICEIWFAVSWIFDQFPKWSPILRETYLDRLSLRYLIFLWLSLYVFVT